MNGSKGFVDPPENAPAGDAFYTPPVPLPEGHVGDSIYQRKLDDPVVALAQGRNWLVLYRSEDARDNPIAVSGIIALPKEPPQAGGYPLITWAHGTVGVAHECAPSRDHDRAGAHPMNRYPHTLLNHFLDQGWAVAMTDYEGLGVTDRTHPYMLGASEARGVLDIVHTARRLFPGQIAERYAIVGHSQGGQAALFAAHHAPERTDNLVGVAAIAPANHTFEVVQAGALWPGFSEGYAFTPMFLCGAMGGDPTIEPEQVLSINAIKYWPQVAERCRAGLSESDSWGGKVTGNNQFRLGYLSSPNSDQENFNAQLREMNPALRIGVPIRIAQSADDDRVPPVTVREIPDLADITIPGTNALVDELRDTNQESEPELLYRFYDEGEVEVPAPDPGDLGAHFATINHDLPALTAWLEGLLTT